MSGYGSSGGGARTFSKAIPSLNTTNVYTKSVKLRDGNQDGSDVNSTFSLIMRAPCKYYTRVRLIIRGNRTTSGTIGGALIATTASATDPVVPTTGNTLTNDGVTGWQTVTFGGATTFAIPVRDTASNITGTTISYSDWINLEQVDATDGGMPFIIIRQKQSVVPFSFFFHGYNTNNDSPTNTDVFTQIYSYNTTNAITTPSDMTFANAVKRDFSPIWGAEFETTTQAARCLCIGDSITAGEGIAQQANPGDYGFVGRNSWVHRMQDIFNTTIPLPISMINYGWGGSKTDEYLAVGKKGIDAHKPAIVLFSVFSPNDTNSAAESVKKFQRAMELANYASSRGALPVFTFLSPRQDSSLAYDNLTKDLRTKVKSRGYQVIDMRAAIEDTASPARFLQTPSPYNQDTIHPSNAGHDAMAAVAAPQIADIYRANFS